MMQLQIDYAPNPTQAELIIVQKISTQASLKQLNLP
jgi:hypothetical protein